jgi:hypothetical protein
MVLSRLDAFFHQKRLAYVAVSQDKNIIIRATTDDGYHD